LASFVSTTVFDGSTIELLSRLVPLCPVTNTSAEKFAVVLAAMFPTHVTSLTGFSAVVHDQPESAVTFSMITPTGRSARTTTLLAPSFPDDVTVQFHVPVLPEEPLPLIVVVRSTCERTCTSALAELFPSFASGMVFAGSIVT